MTAASSEGNPPKSTGLCVKPIMRSWKKLTVFDALGQLEELLAVVFPALGGEIDLQGTHGLQDGHHGLDGV
jgi:hypothetical protein